MLAPLLAASVVAQTPYAPGLLAALDAAAVKWVKSAGKELKPAGKGAAVTLELEIDGSGAVVGLALARSSGNNALDDLARGFVFGAEPFPTPPVRLECLVRLHLTAKPALTAAVACLGAATPELAGVPLGDDPAARLFAGWKAEAETHDAPALKSYRAAVSGAPGWDLPARALGLMLIKMMRVDDAVPHLETYVKARAAPEDAAVYAREIDRYTEFKKKQLAEANRVRQRLSKADIAGGIKKGYALLEPCVKRARNARALAVGVDTLVVTWTIKKDGTVTGARLEAPKGLLMTDHADCVEGAMASWMFPKFSEGSEITAKGVPIRVRGSPPPETVVAAPVAAAPTPAEAADEDPSFSTCSRSEQEIGAYIKKHFQGLSRCVEEEKKRAPNAPLPDQLPIGFVIDTDGSVRGAGVRHRHFRDGPLSGCVASALAGTLAPSGGADCPAEFSIDLRAR